MFRSFEMELAGRKLIVETGKMAKQASGSVLIKYGDTAVLVASTMSKEAREGTDFFPLTVDYEEKMYAVGKMPGGFLRREGRPGNSAVLNARLIDRPIRPLFDKRCRHDVHVVSTVLSVDYDNAPELCGMLGASISLAISDTPWEGPIAGVRVGCINGQYVINPTQEQLTHSTLNVTVAGSENAILMVEGGAEEVPEDKILDAIMFGHETIRKLIAFQKTIIAEVGKPKLIMEFPEIPKDIETAIRDYAEVRLKEAIFNPDKLTREAHMAEVKKAAEEHFKEIYPENEKDVITCLDQLTKEIVRHMISVDKIRPDGRALDEIRPITCEVGLLSRTHGSALFTRGQTQALTITTLAPMSETQIIDDLTLVEEKRYIHQYNFPGYSVGEARGSRGPGRREIGHGALAERALIPVIPSVEEFPYAIRVVSEILESNGSSSQASVCGSTLSLMSAGVPIKAPVAGIAMGLVKDGEHFTILTDIQGMEDALGDMDFKVAGTATGVTAIQMDIKIHGLSREILISALEQAKKGRMFILGKMAECITTPSAHLYLGNFVGCAILALLFVWAGASGTADYFAGFIGNKLSIPLGQMFFRAVLCNFFVCLGVLCGMKLKSDAGRFLMIVMCISGFVVSGFEHCIANMGIFVTAYCLVPGLSLGAIVKSMVVVTLGNMVGGALLLAWPLRKMSADK